jgi:hypothetical protein
MTPQWLTLVLQENYQLARAEACLTSADRDE